MASAGGGGGRSAGGRAGTRGGRLTRFATGAGVGAVGGLLAVDLGLAEIASVWSYDSWVIVAAAALGGLGWLAGLRRTVSALTLVFAALWLVVAYTPLVKHIRHG